MDQEKITQVWKEALMKAGQNLLGDLLTGKQPETWQIETRIKIPKALAEAIIDASKQSGVDPHEIWSEMASAGFRKILNETLRPTEQAKIAQGAQQDILEQMKSIGLDTTGYEASLTQLKDIMKQVVDLERTVEDATGAVTNEEAGEDNQ